MRDGRLPRPAPALADPARICDALTHTPGHGAPPLSSSMRGPSVRFRAACHESWRCRNACADSPSSHELPEATPLHPATRARARRSVHHAVPTEPAARECSSVAAPHCRHRGDERSEAAARRSRRDRRTRRGGAPPVSDVGKSAPHELLRLWLGVGVSTSSPPATRRCRRVPRGGSTWGSSVVAPRIARRHVATVRFRTSLPHASRGAARARSTAAAASAPARPGAPAIYSGQCAGQRAGQSSYHTIVACAVL